MTEQKAIAEDAFYSLLPRDMHIAPTAWCARHVALPGSVLVAQYTPEATPWTAEILDTIADPTMRHCTVMAPIQSGKSVIGEAAACYWLATATGGDLQWNWENDGKALERYDKRIEKILRSCQPVMARWPSNPNKAKRGLVVMPHANLTVQGQEVESNLDSDSVRYQINEEIHSWHSGRLDKATGRLTAVWNAKQLNLSNAGEYGDQLDESFRAGTQERWAFECPHCKKTNIWRTRRERGDNREWLPGGLVYDSEAAKRGPNEYDYAILAPTIYYECEHCCGRIEEHQRRTLKQFYVPTNPHAQTGNRSFTWDSVAVPLIPWLRLVQWKHRALKALVMGDNGPWIQYITERECRPWRADEQPNATTVKLSTGVRKARAHDDDFDTVICSIDVQRGTMGEGAHFWGIVRGYRESGSGVVRSSLIHEGRIETREEAERIISEHAIQPGLVFIDSGDQTESVYQWCAAMGYTPLKGMRGDGFVVETGEEDDEGKPDRVRRIWRCDPDRPVEVKQADGSVIRIPLILYAKDGIRNRLQSIRESGMWQWEIPEDVSEDFVNHYAAEELTYTTEGKRIFRQQKRRNDLFVCDCYQALGYDIWRTFRDG